MVYVYPNVPNLSLISAGLLQDIASMSCEVRETLMQAGLQVRLAAGLKITGVLAAYTLRYSQRTLARMNSQQIKPMQISDEATPMQTERDLG